MANGHTIKTFTAADIEKYHQGLLSAKEMHEMEKAALDDPFLADAIEGYAVPGLNALADIAELKKRLAKKNEQAKVIPITVAGKTFAPWLRAAAMVIAIAGAGLLIYQFGFNNAKEKIAQSPDTAKANTYDNKGSASSTATDEPAKDSTTALATGEKEKIQFKKVVKEEEKNNNNEQFSENAVASRGDSPEINKTSETVTNKPAAVPEYKSKSLRGDAVKLDDNKATDKLPEPKEVLADAKSRSARKQEQANYRDNRDNNAATAQNNTPAYNYNQAQANLARYNVFRGKVTDQQNNALPFANITNPADNIGTYADANGYFVLTSPDTLLNVQVRSIGFENNMAQLRNTSADNQVLLQEDRSLNARVLDTVKRIANRSRRDNMTFEEPEPADGWVNYDMYVANNLKVPDELSAKQNGLTEVQLSFEVNSYGKPVNIKVVKSLCGSCDQEAIRLIKEGPKWKRKSNKKRTTVTVSF